MSCQYRDKCPSATGWCERNQIDYRQCIPFLLSAFEHAKGPMVLYECDRRACSRCSYPNCQHTEDISHAKNFHVCGEKIFVEGEIGE